MEHSIRAKDVFEDGRGGGSIGKVRLKALRHCKSLVAVQQCEALKALTFRSDDGCNKKVQMRLEER